ncbi:hypothetical protein PGB90_009347 [Kerria lacca]
MVDAAVKEDAIVAEFEYTFALVRVVVDVAFDFEIAELIVAVVVVVVVVVVAVEPVFETEDFDDVE